MFQLMTHGFGENVKNLQADRRTDDGQRTTYDQKKHMRFTIPHDEVFAVLCMQYRINGANSIFPLLIF